MARVGAWPAGRPSRPDHLVLAGGDRRMRLRRHHGRIVRHRGDRGQTGRQHRYRRGRCRVAPSGRVGSAAAGSPESDPPVGGVQPTPEEFVRRLAPYGCEVPLTPTSPMSRRRSSSAFSAAECGKFPLTRSWRAGLAQPAGRSALNAERRPNRADFADWTALEEASRSHRQAFSRDDPPIRRAP